MWVWIGVAGLAATGLAAAPKAPPPWPAPVANFVAPKPGEHPRLFFRRGDLPALRARAKRPEGKAILRRLRVLLNGGDGESMPTAYNPNRGKQRRDGSGRSAHAPAGMYTISHAAGFGFLWQITGERKYADLGRQCMEKALEEYRDRDNRYSFRYPYGALRAGASLGWTAVGYDLCYDGWDEGFRKKVARAIQDYNEGRNMSLAELVRGSRHRPASNHWGMQVGGGALGLLAILNDPGVDAVKLRPLLTESRRAMIRNVTEGFGDHGWFAEGDGTGVMASHIAYLPAIQAWRVAGGLDFATPRPNVRWTVLKFVLLTVPRGGKADFPKRGAYPHNVWSREGMSGTGTFCEGFGVVTEPEKTALLWLYNRVSRRQDAAADAPFETASEYPHRAVLAFVNWPLDLKERNPIESVPPAVGDETFGFYAFRNRWRDAKDILISVQTRNTRGNHRANTRGDVEIWAFGRKMKWGRLKANKITHFQPAADGSGVLAGSDGTCLAVDFSKASGADAMLVMTGPGAPGDHTVQAGGTTFSLKFLTAGEEPKAAVLGGKVAVGRQTVSMQAGRIVLGKMAPPWAPAKR